ncbi:MAG: PDZ domain-containing protein, partial [Verrucomicrobiae bacterium]|nr:PDZ domain-containing protein [Verrucomicrobiae bacterium]
TVERDSPAWQVGLREGDRLLQVNGRRIESLRDLGAILRASKGLYSLHIQRGEDLIVLARR